MDALMKKQLLGNRLTFQISLDRIIEKYSRIQNHDGGMAVNLNVIKGKALSRYMQQSKAELDKLESQIPTKLSNESLRAQSTTEYSQLDFTQQSCGADETCDSSVSGLSSVSSACISMQDEGELSGMWRNDRTQLSANSQDESQRSVSEVEQQPEDQDEELEKTLRSHGSLVELYPGMISRIEQAVHRQHVSEAAGSVLRRYRRWRQSNRSLNLNNTFMCNPSKIIPERRSRRENSGSPVRRTGRSPRPHLLMMTNQQDWQQQSPVRGGGSLMRERHKPIVVMDLSGPPEFFEPKDSSLYQTFTVSLNECERGDQPAVCSVSPSRPSYSSLKAPSHLSLRSKRLFNAAHSPQTVGYASQTTRERPDIYGSPVRQSPTKYRLMRSLSRSPLASTRSPKVNPVESYSREPIRPRLESASLSSPQRRTPVPVTIFSSRDSNESFHPQQLPLRSTSAAESRHRLRRHLSFDSSMATSHITYSPKKLDEDFIKLYRKFVCQNKSFCKGSPCCFCARSSDASRGYSSSSLAALALSPHRSVLRKRHRELSLESLPQSKRFRDQDFSSSPGSRRHRTEMLRQPLSPHGSERHYEPRSYSPSKLRESQRFTNQQQPAEHHQDPWMSRSRHRSAAELTEHGSPFERRSAPSGSPRKFW